MSLFSHKFSYGLSFQSHLISKTSLVPTQRLAYKCNWVEPLPLKNSMFISYSVLSLSVAGCLFPTQLYICVTVYIYADTQTIICKIVLLQSSFSQSLLRFLLVPLTESIIIVVLKSRSYFDAAQKRHGFFSHSTLVYHSFPQSK